MPPMPMPPIADDTDADADAAEDLVIFDVGQRIYL